MNAADILERAADEMQRRGKCAGDFSDDRGRVCAHGAIGLACGIPIGLVQCRWPSGAGQSATQALTAFVPPVPEDCWLSAVAQWSDTNDAPTVIAGLRAVAATLRAQSAATPVAEVAHG